MFNKVLLPAILSFCFIFISCASTPIYKFYTKQENPFWDQGRPYSLFENDDIKLLVAFSEYTETQVILSVKITNKTDYKILIDSRNFTI